MNSGQETYQSIEKQQSNLQREKDSQPANSFTQSLLLGTFPITEREREAFSLSVPDIYTSGPLIRSRLYLHNLGHGGMPTKTKKVKPFIGQETRVFRQE